jgi:HEPN domain-containing protein
MESQTQTLLKKSAEDEQTMGLVGVPPTLFGFHAQQAVEKLLKALLSERRVSYPWTHNLKDLINLLTRSGETLPQTPLAITELTAFASVWRYDDPPQEMLLDPTKATETVRILREFVEKRIAEIEGQA